MHRQNPLQQAFVGYVGSGSRALVSEVTDTKMMQEMKGAFLGGENREKIESPQNYGFSSVVLKAKKNEEGKVDECAEAYINFLGGNRTFPVAAVMDDRRFRPMGLKGGENAQYDDIGQMTLMRRGFLAMLSHDGEDGEGKKAERYVSVRHVEKKKQKRPTQKDFKERETWTVAQLAAQEASDAKEREEHKHEGESINTEMRTTKKRIEFRSGDTVVGYYDKQASRWCFIGEVKLGSEDASHQVYGVNGGVGKTTKNSGSGAVLVNAPLPGPPTSLDLQPRAASDAKIAALEARIAALEARIAALEARL